MQFVAFMMLYITAFETHLYTQYITFCLFFFCFPFNSTIYYINCSFNSESQALEPIQADIEYEVGYTLAVHHHEAKTERLTTTHLQLGLGIVTDF